MKTTIFMQWALCTSKSRLILKNLSEHFFKKRTETGKYRRGDNPAKTKKTDGYRQLTNAKQSIAVLDNRALL